MSIDDAGRSAALAARTRAGQEVDPTMMLQRLHRTNRNRTIGLVVTVAAAVVVIATLAVTNGSLTARHVVPAGTPTPTVQSPCDNPAVRCLGSGRYTYTDLPAAVTVTLPANFAGEFRKLSGSSLEDYRTDVDSVGVTVMEDAIPVRYDASWERDPSAGTTAHAMASWLQHRPFLTGATLTATTVGGLPAWRVTGKLRARAALPAPKGSTVGSVAPTFTDGGGGTLGVNKTLVGDYTLVDVPGAGVTVIWSWSDAGDYSVLPANQAYVDGLSFG
jgi:hypothetical protein